MSLKPSRSDAEEAVRTLLSWVGEDPNREGLLDTPRRFVDALGEFCSGYSDCPEKCLNRTFSDFENYQDMVLVRDIQLHSHCEHHISPMIGFAHVAYVPQGKVVGLSKIARVVELYSKRLQTQERMTSQIANALADNLNPLGVAVIIKAKHHCMTMRGVNKPLSWTVTSTWLGCFSEQIWQKRLHSLLSVND